LGHFPFAVNLNQKEHIPMAKHRVKHGGGKKAHAKKARARKRHSKKLAMKA
jgi:hypothetical protein